MKIQTQTFLVPAPLKLLYEQTLFYRKYGLVRIIGIEEAVYYHFEGEQNILSSNKFESFFCMKGLVLNPLYTGKRILDIRPSQYLLFDKFLPRMEDEYIIGYQNSSPITKALIDEKHKIYKWTKKDTLDSEGQSSSKLFYI